jgi:ketosteroid isomerase-like protein
LEKLIATERNFAKTAAEKDTKTAFLKFSADDAINFSPNAINAKELWNSRQANAALLAWTPEFADISANGALGYTTGPWEFRPKGKDDAPIAFGHFVTLWQKQSDGNFKFVLDIGIDHTPAALSEKCLSPNYSAKENTESKPADIVRQFFETAEKKGLERAYKMFLGNDIRLYRQGKLPILGKKNALDEIKKNSAILKAAKRSIFINAKDLAYLSNSYTYLDKNGKEIEKGNFLQIWKLIDGKWQIVLDLFRPVPN